MSKASEWAKAKAACVTTRPVFRREVDREEWPAASLHDSGDLLFYGANPQFSPSEARALAHWILDTFDERSPAPPAEE